ncbi:MAG: RNase adapter RapZ [Fusobacteriaceae bacterium]
MLESIVIVTGLSGAGKTSTLKILEDMEYFTMDNFPCSLGSLILGKYLNEENRERITKIAIGIDIRSFHEIDEYLDFLNLLNNYKIRYEIIFLEASEISILNRYNLTRRKHPLEKNTLLESIASEREIMSEIRDRATLVMDTTYFSNKQLSEKIKENYYKNNKELNEITVHMQSFGFKYGVPIDIDLVFDVRFLPNPYYISELKSKTGNDKDVVDYVMDSEISIKFYEKLLDMLNFLIPNYIKEGKRHLSIGIGCSGGRHRSVTLVNLLSEELSGLSHVKIYKSHREEEKGNW